MTESYTWAPVFYISVINITDKFSFIKKKWNLKYKAYIFQKNDSGSV